MGWPDSTLIGARKEENQAGLARLSPLSLTLSLPTRTRTSVLAQKKDTVFSIKYPMTYYDPPTFGVANVSVAVKKKKAAGKKKK